MLVQPLQQACALTVGVLQRFRKEQRDGEIREIHLTQQADVDKHERAALLHAKKSLDQEAVLLKAEKLALDKQKSLLLKKAQYLKHHEVCLLNTAAPLKYFSAAEMFLRC